MTNLRIEQKLYKTEIVECVVNCLSKQAFTLQLSCNADSSDRNEGENKIVILHKNNIYVTSQHIDIAKNVGCVDSTNYIETLCFMIFLNSYERHCDSTMKRIKKQDERNI